MILKSEDATYAGRLLKVLDKLINEGPWDKSPVLAAMRKKYKELRFRFKSDFQLEGEGLETSTLPPTLANRVAERSGMMEIFISLYNADGGNISKWERILQNINNQLVTRPIYFHEKDVRALIRSKVNKNNEAYVTAFIPKSDVVKPEPTKTPRDKLNHELLILKDNRINAENVQRFFHATGQYLFKNGKLIREGDIEYMDFM